MYAVFSDVESLTESSCSDDFDDVDRSSYGSQALAIFSRLEETIEKIDDFLTFERSFLRGDVVSAASDPLGSRGKIVGVSVAVDLEDVHGGKIPNIPHDDLRKIRSVSTGDYVVRGSWIGRVEKVVDRLTVAFDDGFKRRLTLDGPEKIVPISPDVVEDANYPFYSGQRVKVEAPPPVSKSNAWFCWARKNVKLGTVCHVDAERVYVEWLCCCIVEDGEKTAPSNFQDTKDLTVVSSFANWQLGDWCVLPQARDEDKGLSSNIQEIAVIVKTKTKVDVLWQDGSISLGVDSDSLLPLSIVDAHDFWPHAFVLEKGANDAGTGGSRRWGVVRTVDARERTVKVKWLTSSEEEFVSAYELNEHPEYSYSLGEIVFRAAGDYLASDEDCSDYFDSRYDSCFGAVVGFEDGEIEVKWASGCMTKVAPYKIYRADKFDDVENVQSPVVSSTENVKTQNLGAENIALSNQLLGKNFEEASGFNYDKVKETSSCSISRAAIGFFTSVTSILFASLGGYNRCTEEDEKYHGEELPVEESSGQLCDLHDASFSTDQNEPVKIISPDTRETRENGNGNGNGNGNIKDPSTSFVSKSYEQFDMVVDSSDHHFVNESGIEFQSHQARRSWLKRVHQEWSILEKDLPDSIYVRVYEENVGLLRAAIVGPTGTPYHDGLFFFDVYLPPQYPNEPPMVYYHSNGLRINPNLYESGKVCLSILNTWGGSPCEMWNPESSTVLQVLVSIQGLVLNARPYFNEAGYDSQVGRAEGEKNSVGYNENAFLGNCRSMLYLLRKPPKHFEDLMTEHFNRRGRDILMACEEYMRGATVGSTEMNVNGNSKGFKMMLGKLLPKLVEAFSETGLGCTDLSGRFS